MKYLFFDVEGANSYNYVSKMCTFGYVIANENFEVESKIDVIMNPEAQFDRHIINENMNAYPLDTYPTRPPFSYFYNSIKKILENKDQYIIGWSINNDVRYIYDACKRYNLPQIEYKYFDLQQAYIKIFKLDSANSLEAACNKCDIVCEHAHKSDEDAYYTMKLLQKLCESRQQTIEEFLHSFEECFSDVAKYAESAYTDEEIEEKIQRRNTINYIKFAKAKKQIFDPFIIKDKIYAFTSDIIDQEKEQLKKYVQHICDAGGKCSVHIDECDFLICSPESIEKLSKSPKFANAKLMTFKSFVKRIVKS